MLKERMRKIFLSGPRANLLFPIFAAFLIGWSQQAFAYLCESNGPKAIKAEVEKVLDGDTIKIKYRNKVYSVRLLAIDTPESNFRNQSQGEWAEKAKFKAEALINTGSIIKIQFEGERCDRFKRLLGVVISNGKNVNVELVRLGLAVSYCFNEPIPICNRVWAAMDKAISKKSGFHVDPNFQYPYDFRADVQGFSDSPWVQDLETGEWVRFEFKSKIPASRRLFSVHGPSHYSLLNEW